MKKKTVSLAIACALLANSLFSFANSHEDSRFINRKAEGWFWYEVIPEAEPLLEEEPEVVFAAPPPEPEPEQPKQQNKGPEVFSAAWFRDNLDKYLDAAWDNPTLENVQAYLYLQRYAMDRSEQFADVAEMAVTGNPMLDEMTRRPTATYGSQKVDQVAGRLREEAIVGLAEQAGVFFFYDETDEYSAALAPLVKLLEQSGFTILAVGSGSPIPGYEHDFNYRTDMGHAEQLGVTTLPAIFLASPDGIFAPVGQGIMSLTDMTNRMLVVAKREGWITEDQFNKTRPLTNSDNIAEMLASKGAGEGDLNTETDPDNDNFVSPEQLLKFVKSRTKGTQSATVMEFQR